MFQTALPANRPSSWARRLLALALPAALLLSIATGCGGQELHTPLVISEVQAGAVGNNNYEFIELYNSTADPLDLVGYRLLYTLPSGEENLVYAWEESAVLPPHSHYLLARAGVNVGLLADAEFEQPLNTSFGGLVLLDPAGAVADRLGWGNAPELGEGRPAAALEAGSSLERKPGGEDGNGHDSDNNRADFRLNDHPSPQNSGSPPTPAESERLAVSLQAPSSVEPGAQFDYELTATNETGTTVHDVELTFTVPPSLTIVAASGDGAVESQTVTWSFPEMGVGETAARAVTVEAPLTYLDLRVREATLQASDWPSPAFAAPVRTRVEGGVLPIAAARVLQGETVTVEGTATMYTGGYYAGTDNAKFYLQDESGGIQIQCFDENGTPPVVALGDRVRVSGEAGIYRNALQIVPADNALDVTVIEHGDPIPPQEMTIGELLTDPNLPGGLVVVSGQATRIEEFTYSYEIDLADEMGNILLVYVDKQTNLDLAVEAMDVGHLYTVAGIAEWYNDTLQLKPRVATDLTEVFPPVLMVAGSGPVNALTGATVPYTITAFNHTDAPLTNVVITSTLPGRNGDLASVEDEGQVVSNTIAWILPTLPAHASASVHFAVTVTGTEGIVTIPAYSAWADEWPDPATNLPLRTFIGNTVPIWAIQGPVFTSPYKLAYLDTEGVVTGIFPDLDGFWIQSRDPDDDPATSEALFVYAGEIPVDVAQGDMVRVHGRVRERGSQTELHIAAPEDVQVLETGLPLPTPVPLDPPLEEEAAITAAEELEGMLVTLAGPAVAVGPVNQYGEYALVLAEHNVERVLHGDPTGLLILVDDGSQVRHTDGSTLPYLVHSGDRVTDLSGPLAFTFGNYKIEPLAPPTVTSTAPPALPSLPEPGPDEFSVATFNMENYFDSRDPHPVSDPPRPTRGEYDWKTGRIAQVIAALGAPTLFGAEAVENIDVLEDLAAQPALAPYDYQAVLIEGPSSRGIDVGFLVRGDRATVEGVAQRQAPEGLFSRPPLLITITLHTASAGDVTVYAIVNHFISKSGGEALTEPRRVMEAEWNAHLVDQILAVDPDAYVIVMGDLNDYYDSAPLQALTAGETSGGQLVHTMTGVPREERYSFIYQGVSQLLDHILVTPALASHLVQAQALHVDADYPLPEPDTADPHRCADHDPVVAVFSLDH